MTKWNFPGKEPGIVEDGPRPADHAQRLATPAPDPLSAEPRATRMARNQTPLRDGLRQSSRSTRTGGQRLLRTFDAGYGTW